MRSALSPLPIHCIGLTLGFGNAGAGSELGRGKAAKLLGRDGSAAASQGLHQARSCTHCISK
jgi:hypothetical protein